MEIPILELKIPFFLSAVIDLTPGLYATIVPEMIYVAL